MRARPALAPANAGPPTMMPITGLRDCWPDQCDQVLECWQVLVRSHRQGGNSEPLGALRHPPICSAVRSNSAPHGPAGRAEEPLDHRRAEIAPVLGVVASSTVRRVASVGTCANC
jgi:hypothetical protein